MNKNTESMKETKAPTFDDIYAMLVSVDEEPGFSPMSLMSNKALLEAATGKIDLNMVARTYLAARGIDGRGWAGSFEKAKEYWRNQK